MRIGPGKSRPQQLSPWPGVVQPRQVPESCCGVVRYNDLYRAPIRTPALELSDAACHPEGAEVRTVGNAGRLETIRTGCAIAVLLNGGPTENEIGEVFVPLF